MHPILENLRKQVTTSNKSISNEVSVIRRQKSYGYQLSTKLDITLDDKLMRQKNKPPRWICVRYNHNLLFDRLHPSNKVKKP